MNPTKSISRGKVDFTRGFKPCIGPASVYDQTLRAIFLPNTKKATHLYCLTRPLQHTLRVEQEQELLVVSWAAQLGVEERAPRHFIRAQPLPCLLCWQNGVFNEPLDFSVTLLQQVSDAAGLPRTGKAEKRNVQRCDVHRVTRVHVAGLKLSKGFSTVKARRRWTPPTDGLPGIGKCHLMNERLK
jgi:hypothetical protein